MSANLADCAAAVQSFSSIFRLLTESRLPQLACFTGSSSKFLLSCRPSLEIFQISSGKSSEDVDVSGRRLGLEGVVRVSGRKKWAERVPDIFRTQRAKPRSQIPRPAGQKLLRLLVPGKDGSHPIPPKGPLRSPLGVRSRARRTTRSSGWPALTFSWSSRWLSVFGFILSNYTSGYAHIIYVHFGTHIYIPYTHVFACFSVFYTQKT